MTIRPELSFFEPVTRHTVSSEVRRRLVEAISSGRLAPGTPIAAERTLCQEFGVARTSVREAIQGLVIAGFVERRGNRLVVADRMPEPDGAARAAATGPAAVRDLLEMRSVVEPPLVEMATRRAAAAQRYAIAAIAAAPAGGERALRATDRAFHLALGGACGNAVLAAVHADTIDALFGAAAFTEAPYPPTASDTMAALAAAVAGGHPRKAHAASTAHLDAFAAQHAVIAHHGGPR